MSALQRNNKSGLDQAWLRKVLKLDVVLLRADMARPFALWRPKAALRPD